MYILNSGRMEDQINSPVSVGCDQNLTSCHFSGVICRHAKKREAEPFAVARADKSGIMGGQLLQEA